MLNGEVIIFAELRQCSCQKQISFLLSTQCVNDAELFLNNGVKQLKQTLHNTIVGNIGMAGLYFYN